MYTITDLLKLCFMMLRSDYSVKLAMLKFNAKLNLISEFQATTACNRSYNNKLLYWRILMTN